MINIGMISFLYNTVHKHNDQLNLQTLELKKALEQLKLQQAEQLKTEEALYRSQAELLQAQKMESLGKLAGGIAHDFNNLLTAISGYGELALQSLAESEPARDDLSEILATTAKASALVRQLLTFSRRQEVQRQLLNANEVIGEMSKLLKRFIGENIKLTINLATTPQLVKVDRGQLEQVIMNLAVNARDAMTGGGLLFIETSSIHTDEENVSNFCKPNRTVESGEYAVISVTDTGIGMDEATLAQIFEPFFTTKSPGKGTGLGLATTFDIIEQSNGYISVYSKPGLGTTFNIYLPLLTCSLTYDT